MTIVIFKDAEKKYQQARECIEFNIWAVTDEKAPNKDATWYDHPTMVKWLKDSSNEFLQDYVKFSNQLKGRTHHEDSSMNEWTSNLIALVNEVENRAEPYLAGAITV